MKRRTFLKSSAAVAVAQSLPWSAHAQDGWRTFETVTRVEVKDAFGVARAWVPLPLEADTDWHKLPQQFDASILSDECIAPGQARFTGAFVGVACQDLAGTCTPADFDFFEYQ